MLTDKIAYFYHSFSREGIYLILFPHIITSLEDALVLSLLKWHILSEVPLFDGGGATCGLCRYDMHIAIEKGHKISDCVSCPVQQKTGLPQCQSTPYMSYSKIIDLQNLLDLSNPDKPRAERAKDELVFLQGIADEHFPGLSEKVAEFFATIDFKEWL